MQCQTYSVYRNVSGLTHSQGKGNAPVSEKKYTISLPPANFFPSDLPCLRQPSPFMQQFPTLLIGDY